jgi:hypothetical protein
LPIRLGHKTLARFRTLARHSFVLLNARAVRAHRAEPGEGGMKEFGELLI